MRLARVNKLTDVPPPHAGTDPHLDAQHRYEHVSRVRTSGHNHHITKDERPSRTSTYACMHACTTRFPFSFETLASRKKQDEQEQGLTLNPSERRELAFFRVPVQWHCQCDC